MDSSKKGVIKYKDWLSSQIRLLHRFNQSNLGNGARTSIRHFSTSFNVLMSPDSTIQRLRRPKLYMMKFHILSNEIVNQFFSYSIQGFLSIETRKERSVLEYQNLCSYAAVSRWWRSMVTSQLATEIAKLDEQSLSDIFRSAVSKNQLMGLYAIYASGRPSFLSRPRPSSLPCVSTTIEEHELCTAARNGSYIIVQWLTAQGVSANATDDAGRGALHTSAAHGEMECARLLLEKDANPDLIRRGGSPLHCAVDKSSRGNIIEMMRLLLDYQANPTARDRDDQTVLYRASGAGLTRGAELLLDKGAPIEDRQNDMTALMIASRNRRAGTAQLLLERGADVNSVLPATGHDSLCLAVIGHDTWGRDSSRVQLEWTIKSLIEHGADVSGNAQKVPPLSLALSEQSYLRFVTVEILLNAGADIEKPDFRGFTPLETWILKSSWYDTGVLHLLLKRAVNVNRLNGEHKSPLAQVCGAAGSHSLDLRVSVIQMLIQYEADVNHADDNGDTPAMIISMNEALSAGQKVRLLQLLLDNGADTWLENRHRETLLIKAMKHFTLGTQERRKVLDLILHCQEQSQ